MSRIKSVARNLNLFLSREIAELLGVIETRLNDRADAYEKAVDQRNEERLIAIEKTYDERLSNQERLNDERFQAINLQISEQIEERLASAETNFNTRLEGIEKKFDERATNYETAIDTRIEERLAAFDARIEERLATLDDRLNERLSSAESQLDAQFNERARAVDGRVDDRLSKADRHLDERLDQAERRTDDRIEAHERRTDQSLERNRVDILDRTDIMLQILEQRLDQQRRDLNLLREEILHTASSGRSSQKIRKSANGEIPEKEQIEPDNILDQPADIQIKSFRKLAQSRGSLFKPGLHQANSSLYQRILDWKKVATEGLNKFTTDEQEVVDYILSFIGDADERHYVMQHMRRFLATLQRIPPPQRSTDNLLELGSLMHLAPAISKFTGYKDICGADMWESDEEVIRETLKQVDGGESFSVELRNYDVERDRFPYPDGHFRVVLCCELIEHLQSDPMHMLWECNRVLTDDGFLLLTTPNITSCRSIEGVLIGCTPYLLSQYNRQTPIDQHNREYAPFEVGIALAAAGFTVIQLETDDVWLRSNPAILALLEEVNLPTDMRGDNIFALARKSGTPTERYPKELYID